ncbi:MAG TPA: tetratricopeptide repeat protein [Candidatus Acidoferrales bacterium]|nr:tetratricopeptide repeat protein [Candidatus Acidoferrales bacterium]
MTKLLRHGMLMLTLLAPSFAGMQDGLDQRLRELREQAAEHPGRLDLRLALGNTAVQAENYDMALQAFQEVLAAIDPDSAAAGDVELRIGETYRRKGDLDSAATALGKARQLLPDNPVVAGTLGLVFDLSGKFSEAEEAYRAALKLDPENPTTLNNLAYLLAMHGGGLDEARSLAAKAHRIAPDSADFADTLAVVYTRTGDLDTARTLLLDLVGRDPSDEGYRRHLAAVLDRESARNSSEQALLEALKATGSAASPDQITALVAKIR